MKPLIIITALAIVGWGSYWQGHRIGLSSAPEMVSAQQDHNDNLERMFQEQFDNPTSQELMCEQIIDLVLSEVNDPAHLAHQPDQ